MLKYFDNQILNCWKRGDNYLHDNERKIIPIRKQPEKILREIRECPQIKMKFNISKIYQFLHSQPHLMNSFRWLRVNRY